MNINQYIIHITPIISHTYRSLFICKQLSNATVVVTISNIACQKRDFCGSGSALCLQENAHLFTFVRCRLRHMPCLLSWGKVQISPDNSRMIDNSCYSLLLFLKQSNSDSELLPELLCFKNNNNE